MKTHPVATFVRTWAVLLLTFAVAALCTGCADISYSVTKSDGSKASASARSLFSNTAIKGFNADSSTEKTRTGLKFQTSDSSPDNEAIRTLFEGIGTAAGVAAKTAVKP